VARRAGDLHPRRAEALQTQMEQTIGKSMPMQKETSTMSTRRLVNPPGLSPSHKLLGEMRRGQSMLILRVVPHTTTMHRMVRHHGQSLVPRKRRRTHPQILGRSTLTLRVAALTITTPRPGRPPGPNLAQQMKLSLKEIGLSIAILQVGRSTIAIP